MTAHRSWLALAASLLACACASPGVLLQTPQANFGRAYNVLASVATAQGLTAMHVSSSRPRSGYERRRTAMEVFMPGEHQDTHAHTTPLVYSMEVSDVTGDITLWIGDPAYAAPLCQALRAADISFNVAEGADRAPECVAP